MTTIEEPKVIRFERDLLARYEQFAAERRAREERAEEILRPYFDYEISDEDLISIADSPYI